MSRQLSDALEICLQAIEGGEGLEAALARFPHLAQELRPLLETAQAARTLGLHSVPTHAINRGRMRLLVAAASLRKEEKRRFFLAPVWRIAVVTLTVVVFLAVSGSGLLTASARSLPGDALYPFKRSVEDTQLRLTTDASRKQELQVQFRQRRIEETESLITSRRVETVDFKGIVTTQITGGWLVAGFPVVINPQTQIDGTIKVGVEVEVFGETQADGSVRALRLTLDGGRENRGVIDAENESADTPNPQGHDFKPGKIETSKPTDSHGDDRGREHHGARTPEPTDSHGGDRRDHHSSEPTKTPGFEDFDTHSPEPTGWGDWGHH